MIETHAQTWTNRPDMALREQNRIGNNGHAVTLLWADLPDDDEEDDGGLAEPGTPGVR